MTHIPRSPSIARVLKPVRSGNQNPKAQTTKDSQQQTISKNEEKKSVEKPNKPINRAQTTGNPRNLKETDSSAPESAIREQNTLSIEKNRNRQQKAGRKRQR